MTIQIPRKLKREQHAKGRLIIADNLTATTTRTHTPTHSLTYTFTSLIETRVSSTIAYDAIKTFNHHLILHSRSITAFLLARIAITDLFPKTIFFLHI